MTFLALYAGCFTLGGILIAASMFGGGKDVDGESHGSDTGGHAADAGDTADTEGHSLAEHMTGGKEIAHHDHGQSSIEALKGIGSLATIFLSLRFWTFALAAFGMTGLLLTLLAANPVLVLSLSVLTGGGVGAGVTTLLRAVSRDTVSSALDARSLRGRDAEVVLSIGPDKLGKVRLVHNGQIIELPGTTREGRLLERGERVLVVDVSAGTADVTPVTPERGVPPVLHTLS